MSQSIQETVAQAEDNGQRWAWWFSLFSHRQQSEVAQDAKKPSRFRLGVLGDTRSGKTMYFTALFDITNRGKLPPDVNIKPKPGVSQTYLMERVGNVQGGEWPSGNIDVYPIDLVIDYAGRTYDLHSKDFKGGDFPNLVDPKSKEDFERFVAELFDGCSAYVFLVDPGDLKEGGQAGPQSESDPRQKSEFKEKKLRVTTSLAAAMEQTRPSGRVSHFFYRPIAIVFTKCDLHPEVMADPERFAEKHLETVRRHLKQHAPKRHKFFAISSTGPVPNIAKPPVPLRPQRLTEPLTWCIDQHIKRWKVVRMTAIVAVLILMAASYAWLFGNNQRQIADVRSRIPESADHELPGLFQRATSLKRSLWSWLTHPIERERLRQEVAGDARQRMDEDIQRHVGADGVLRELGSYGSFATKVTNFGQSYAGTADAEDLRGWLIGQRKQLAERTVAELEQLAEAGNETAFGELLQEYKQQVALPELEDRLKGAIETLNKRVNWGLVSLLRDQRLTRTSEIDVIRETLQKVEEDIKLRGLLENYPQVKYVRKVREVYEDLKNNTPTRNLHFELRARSPNPWMWEVTRSGTNAANSGGWQKPSREPNSDFHLQTSPQFPVDLLNQEPLKLTVHEDTYFRNGRASNDFRLRELRFGEDREMVTDKGKPFSVRWHDDGGISEHFAAVGEIEKLEEELFRAKNPQ